MAKVTGEHAGIRGLKQKNGLERIPGDRNEDKAVTS